MSTLSRREKIEQMLLDEPNDLFLRYGLALEFHREGKADVALSHLQELTRETPPYVPAYFRSAQILVDLDCIEQARDFLRDGIEVARSQNDLHAAAEMSELLSDLGQYGE